MISIKSKWTRVLLGMFLVILLVGSVSGIEIDADYGSTDISNPSVSLTWTQTATWWTGFQSYNITRSPDCPTCDNRFKESLSISVLNTSNVNLLTFEDTDVQLGQAYVYKITGVDIPVEINYTLPITIPTSFYEGFTDFGVALESKNSTNITWDIEYSGTNLIGQPFISDDVIQIKVFRNGENITTLNNFLGTEFSYHDNNDTNGLNPGTYTYYLNVTYENGESHTTTPQGITIYADPVILVNNATLNRSTDILTWNVTINASYDITFEGNATYRGYTYYFYPACDGTGEIKTCNLDFDEFDFTEDFDVAYDIELSATIYKDDNPLVTTTFGNTTDIENAKPYLTNVGLTGTWTQVGSYNYSAEYSFNDEDVETDSDESAREIRWYALNYASGELELQPDFNDSTWFNTSADKTVKFGVRVQDDSGNWSNWVNSTEEKASGRYYEDFASIDAEATGDGQITVTWEYTEDGQGGWDNTLSAYVSEIVIEKYENGELNKTITRTGTDNMQLLTFVDNEALEGDMYNYSIYIRFVNGEEDLVYLDEEIEGNQIPRQVSEPKITFDRDSSEDYDYIYFEWIVNDTSGNKLFLSATYNGKSVQTVDAECDKGQSTRYNCTAIVNENLGVFLDKGEPITFEDIYVEEQDGTDNDFILDYAGTDKSATVTNAKPVTTVLGIDEIETNDGTNLLCNYTVEDKDASDDEVPNKTNITWLIQNEGVGDFLPIIGQNKSVLTYDYFDNGDRLKCKVKANDGEDYSIYEDTSYVMDYNPNLSPIIYFTNSSTSEDAPANVGGYVDFLAKLIDPDGSFFDMTVVFCRKDLETFNSDETEEITFIDNDENASEMWLFKENLGYAISQINLKIYNLTDENGNSIPYSKPIYSIFVYESDSYNQTTFTKEDIVITDQANILVANSSNIFKFDKTVPQKDYYSIKICVDSDFNQECDKNSSNSFTIRGTTNETFIDNKYFRLVNTSFKSKNIIIDREITSASEYCGELNIAEGDYVSGEDIFEAIDVQINDKFLESSISNQTFTVFAIDGDGAISSDTGMVYVNHPPTVEDESIKIEYRGITGTEGFVELNFSENSSIGENKTIYCNFTIADIDHENNFTDWDAEYLNYSVNWWYKEVGSDEWNICGDERGCVGSVSKYLSYASTAAGDSWKCEVIPKDRFISGTALNSSAFTILNSPDGNYTNLGKPYDIEVVDDSNNNVTGLKYAGNNLNVDLSWEDEDSSKFNIFVCEGSAKVERSGCLWNELYRNVNYVGNIGSNNLQFQFEIPDYAVPTTGPGSYKVYIYDESGLLSVSDSETFHAISLRDVNVSVINWNGSEFSDNEANIDQSLKCKFNFTKNGIYYNNTRFNGLLQNKSIEVNWKVNGLINPDYRNAQAISYGNTADGDTWSCLVEFLETPDGKTVNSDNEITIINTTTNTLTAPELIEVIAPSEILLGEDIEYVVNWKDADNDGVRIFICNSSEIELSGCIGKEYAKTSTFVNSNFTLYYTPTINDGTDFVAHVRVFDSNGLKSNNLSAKTRIIPDITIETRPVPELTDVDINITGVVSSGNPSIIANETLEVWVYKDADYTTLIPGYNDTQTAELNNYEREVDVKLTAAKGSELIYVDLDAYGTFNDTKFIGFASHTRENYTYYDIVNVSQNSQYTIVNISEGLEEGINVGTAAYIYEKENVTGKFKINVPLFSDSDNYIVFKIKNYEEQLSTIVYKDVTGPNAEINLNESEGIFVKNQKLVVNVSEENELNHSSIKIVLENLDIGKNDTYNFTNEVLKLETENLSILKKVRSEKISDKKSTFEFTLENLITGNYNISIYAEDSNGVPNEMSFGPFYYDSKKIVPSIPVISDSVTGSTTVLNSFNMTIKWEADDMANISKVDYKLYEDNQMVFEATAIGSNITGVIYVDGILKNDSTYHFEIQTTTKWGEISAVKRSSDIKYVEKPMIISNIVVSDGLTGWTNKVRSNEIKVTWDVDDDKIKKEYAVILYGDNDTQAGFTYSDDREVLFELQNPGSYSEYYAVVYALTTTDVVSNSTSTTIPYDDSTKLVLEIDSDGKFVDDYDNDIIAFNNLLNFTIKVTNGNEWKWELINLSNNDVLDTNSTTFTDIYDKTMQIVDMSMYSEDTYMLKINAISNFDDSDTEEKTFIVVRDDTDPELTITEIQPNYYMNKTIVINFTIKDNWEVRDTAYVYLNGEEYPVNNISQNYGGDGNNTKNFSFSIDAEEFRSNDTIDVIIKGYDYANNIAINDTETILIKNRAPYEETQVPTLIWNKFAFYSEYDISNYISDRDLGDDSLIRYTIVSDGENGTDLNIKLWDGIIYGNLRHEPNDVFDLAINISDGKPDGSDIIYVTINVSTGSCPPSGEPVGFGDECKGTDFPDLAPIADTTAYKGELFKQTVYNISEGELDYTVSITPSQTINFNTTTKQIKWTPNATGEYNITVVGENIKGNDTIRFTVNVKERPNSGGDTNPGGNSGGTGTSGGGFVPSFPSVVDQNSYTANIYNFESGDTKTIDVNVDLAIDKISFTAIENIPYAKIIITKLLSRPSGTELLDNVYQYLEIDATNLEDKFNFATLTVAIDKYNLQDIGKDNAAAYRWVNNEWQEYPLKYKSEDLVNYYYTVSVPGFSYWAIAKVQEVEPEEPIVTEPGVEEPEVVVEPEVEEPAVIEPTMSKTNNVNSVLLYSLLILFIGGFVVAGFVMSKNKKSTIQETQTTNVIDPLPEYIKRQLAKGIAKEKIMAALIAAGWKKEDIEKHFDDNKSNEKRTIDMNLVDHQLVKQIKTHQENGLNREQIQQELKEQNVDPSVIEHNINYQEAVSKLEEQVGEWVEKGYTLAEIKTHLLDLNWPVMTIYNILKKFK